MNFYPKKNVTNVPYAETTDLEIFFGMMCFHEIINVILQKSYILYVFVILVNEMQDGNQPQRWRSGLEHSPRKRKVGCSNPSRHRPKSLKQEVTAPLPNARH